jgi:hypothetical protein
MKLLDLLNSRHQQILVEELARAKRIINEQSGRFNSDKNNMMQRLAKWKIASWLEDNADLDVLQSYKFNSGGMMQDYSVILNVLKTGNPSQSYLKSLIDDLDTLEGVAIDDQDFYDDNSKQIPGRTQDFPFSNTSKEKKLTYNNFIQMVRDDMMAGAAPDEYPSDERVRKDAKYLYNRYLQGASIEDLF